MSAPALDNDLLFALLGLRLGFFDPDALQPALRERASDPSRSLGEILVESGRLTPARRAELDTHVREHLAGRPPAHLSNLLRTGVETGSHINGVSGGPSEPAESPPSGPRYRPLRQHARGGLGEVFVARDEELHRDVALKEIHPEHADDANLRGRFLLEAQVTGGLEHPGIVPVYGLGTHPDGRPFYAMRFVHGTDLKGAIDRFHQAGSGFAGVEFRGLLRRFLDVCNAVAYAHSRGVLHRDLKPANVMLGKYGETLVVDWGLAKPLGKRPGSEPDDAETTLRPAARSGVEETHAGTVMGTPAYMSPEQAGGLVDQLGPASDVYSLGAILFTLLTGQPPLKGRRTARCW